MNCIIDGRASSDVTSSSAKSLEPSVTHFFTVRDFCDTIAHGVCEPDELDELKFKVQPLLDIAHDRRFSNIFSWELKLSFVQSSKANSLGSVVNAYEHVLGRVRQEKPQAEFESATSSSLCSIQETYQGRAIPGLATEASEFIFIYQVTL